MMLKKNKSDIAIAIAFKDKAFIKSLVDCINSFLNQTISPKELIVVGTRNDLSNLSNYFSKEEFRLINIVFSNSGKNEARNTGILMAKSKFVMFVDHDMRAEKNLLSECIKSAKKYDALFIPEIGSGGNFWNECLKLQREFVQYDLDTITPRFFRKNIFRKGEKPFSSEFGELDEWGFNISLQKKKIKIGPVQSFVLIKDNTNIAKKMKNKYLRGLWLPNFYKANNKEAWRRVDPIKRGIVFYGNRLRYFFKNPLVFTGLLFLKVIALFSFFSGAFMGFLVPPNNKILKKDIRNFYNSIASSYFTKMYKSSRWGKYVNYIEKKSVIDIWQLQRNEKINKEKILDLGMGPGRWSKFFIDIGFNKVVGLDLSDKMVGMARKEIKSIKFRSVIADIENIPFKGCSFDKVFCFRTFKYLPNPKNAINEIVRVTKRNGDILLELPNKSLQNGLLKLFSIFIIKTNPDIKPNSNWWYFNKAKLYSYIEINALLKEVPNIKINKIIPLFILPSVAMPKIIDKHFFKTLVFLDNLFMLILPKRIFTRSWIVSVLKQ